MINLEKFLNNGGKRSRIVSGNSGTLPGGQLLTISPAADEFVVLWGDVIRTPELTLSVTGRGVISLSHSDAQDGGIPIAFGLGEEVVINNTTGSSKDWNYRIYEEDV